MGLPQLRLLGFLEPAENVYWAIKRYNDTGNLEDRHRSGRPRISTPSDDRLLIRASLRNQKDTVPELRTEWTQNRVVASNTTVRRCLHDAGLKGCVAVKKPLLTFTHRQKSLAFEQNHPNWTWVDWSTVLWTDESRFTLFQSDGRTYVR